MIMNKSKRIKISLLLLSVAFALMPLDTFAYVNNHGYSSNDVMFFDPENDPQTGYKEGGGGGGGGTNPCISGLSGDNNEAKVFNFFTARGLTEAQAAGLLGNFLVEDSTLDPTVTNEIGAYGIVQWLGGRLAALKSTHPDDYDTLEGQLNFVMEEFASSESYAYSKLTAATTAEDAAKAVFTYYERPGDSSLQARIDNAVEQYDQLSGSGGGGGTVECPEGVSPVPGFDYGSSGLSTGECSDHGRVSLCGNYVNKPGHNTFHGGDALDIFGAGGSTAVTAYSGTVTVSACVHNPCDSFGRYVEITSTDGNILALYAHINTSVSVGDTVVAGQEIGTLVSSLSSPHIHFELQVDGGWIKAGDMYAYLSGGS